MQCTRCGSKLDEGAMVCGQCGAVVGASYGPPSGATKPGVPKPAPTKVEASPGTAPKLPAFTSGAGRAKGLVERIKALLRSPATEWQVIADESATAMDIYLGYVAPLAAIGAAALFVGQVMIGSALPLVGVIKASVVTGAAASLLLFALTLLWVFLLSLFTNAMAPKFQGQPDPMRALKLAAYSETPLLLAGVLHAIPQLGFLWIVAAIYGAYLAFVGLPILMRVRKEHALLYAGALALAGYFLLTIFGLLTVGFTGAGPEFIT